MKNISIRTIIVVISPAYFVELCQTLVFLSFFFSACQEGDNSTFDQCGQRCTCQKGQLVDCVRIRKEFTSMKTEERKRYIRVIKTASTDPKFKRDYDLLINEHRELFHKGLLFSIRITQRVMNPTGSALQLLYSYTF